VGAFQALKHRAADIFIDAEHLRHLALGACDQVGASDAGATVAMTKIAADELHGHAARETLQLHGGLGYTWEVPVHRYLKASLRQRFFPRATSEYMSRLQAELSLP
jgi:alkylation response protein AidB-like acyl-CoA dehydrogenase